MSTISWNKKIQQLKPLGVLQAIEESESLESHWWCWDVTMQIFLLQFANQIFLLQFANMQIFLLQFANGMCVKNNTIIYIARASNGNEHDLYYCLLPRCEALRTCRSGFRSQQNVVKMRGNACSRCIYYGGILHAHPVRGEITQSTQHHRRGCNKTQSE